MCTRRGAHRKQDSWLAWCRSSPAIEVFVNSPRGVRCTTPRRGIVNSTRTNPLARCEPPPGMERESWPRSHLPLSVPLVALPLGWLAALPAFGLVVWLVPSPAGPRPRVLEPDCCWLSFGLWRVCDWPFFVGPVYSFLLPVLLVPTCSFFA